MKTTSRGIAAAIATFCTLAMPASAQEVKLKFAFFSPETHPWWSDGGRVFTEKVAELTENQVSFEPYPANQLGSDYTGLLLNGLADLVMIPAGYIPEKLPLSGIAELPNFQTSACDGADKLSAMGRKGGVLDRLEYEPLGIRVLWVGQGSPYPILTNAAPVQGVDDLRGLKIRTVGAVQGASMRALGAIPVQVPATELYDMLSRGTADGAIYGFASMPTYDLQNVLHHSLEGVGFGSSGVFVAISEKRWESLPENVREALEAASPIAQQALCEKWDLDHARIRDEMVERGTLTIHDLSEAEIERMDVLLAPVPQEWAATLDEAGRGGSEVLEAWQALKVAD